MMLVATRHTAATISPTARFIKTLNSLGPKEREIAARMFVQYVCSKKSVFSLHLIKGIETCKVHI